MTKITKFLFSFLLFFTISFSSSDSYSIVVPPQVIDLANKVLPVDKVIEGVKEGISDYLKNREMCSLACMEKKLRKSCGALRGSEMKELQSKIQMGLVGPTELVDIIKSNKIRFVKKTGAIGRMCKEYCQTKVEFWLPKSYRIILKIRFQERELDRGLIKRGLRLGKGWNLSKCVAAYNKDPYALYQKILKDKEELKKGNELSIAVYNPYQLNSALALVKEAAKLNPNAVGEGALSATIGEGMKLETGELQFNENIHEITEIQEKDANGNLLKTIRKVKKKVLIVDPKEELKKFYKVWGKLKFLKKNFESLLLPSPYFTFDSVTMKSAMNKVDARPTREIPEKEDIQQIIQEEEKLEEGGPPSNSGK